MTTKSMQMSRSSITDSHAETKKVTRTEEQSDRERLMVDCRISADASIINSGIIRFMAANGILPTKLDTKSPSTTPYIEVKIIMDIDGKTKRISLPYPK